jgi:hypothetical protein
MFGLRLTLTSGRRAVRRIIDLSNPEFGNFDYEDTTVGEENIRTLRITNLGNSTLHVTNIDLPTGFSVASSWSSDIPAGTYQDIPIAFTPPSTGPFGGIMSVSSNKTGGTSDVEISGNGVAAGGTPAPPMVDYTSGDLDAFNTSYPDLPADTGGWVAYTSTSGIGDPDSDPSEWTLLGGPSYEQGDYAEWSGTGMSSGDWGAVRVTSGGESSGWGVGQKP